MTQFIDADAATLAGLQIDQLQKIRQNQITLEHLRWFLGLTKDARDAYVTGKPASMHAPTAALASKFRMLTDLGIVTVSRYRYELNLDVFRQETASRFSRYHPDITEDNFRSASVCLAPGQKFNVRTFEVIGEATANQCLAFLKSQGAVLLGAHGIPLVFCQKLIELPPAHRYASLDEKTALWKNRGKVFIPTLTKEAHGLICHFDLCSWGDDLQCALLAFFNVEQFVSA
jgi:hypothetical protein